MLRKWLQKELANEDEFYESWETLLSACESAQKVVLGVYSMKDHTEIQRVAGDLRLAIQRAYIYKTRARKRYEESLCPYCKCPHCPHCGGLCSETTYNRVLREKYGESSEETRRTPEPCPRCSDAESEYARFVQCPHCRFSFTVDKGKKVV